MIASLIAFTALGLPIFLGWMDERHNGLDVMDREPHRLVSTSGHTL